MSKNVRLYLLNCELDQLISRTDNATSKAKSSQFANDEECVVQVESYLLDKALKSMPCCDCYCRQEKGVLWCPSKTCIHPDYSHPTKLIGSGRLLYLKPSDQTV